MNLKTWLNQDMINLIRFLKGCRYLILSDLNSDELRNSFSEVVNKELFMRSSERLEKLSALTNEYDISTLVDIHFVTGSRKQSYLKLCFLVEESSETLNKEVDVNITSIMHIVDNI